MSLAGQGSVLGEPQRSPLSLLPPGLRDPGTRLPEVACLPQLPGAPGLDQPPWACPVPGPCGPERSSRESTASSPHSGCPRGSRAMWRAGSGEEEERPRGSEVEHLLGCFCSHQQRVSREPHCLQCCRGACAPPASPHSCCPPPLPLKSTQRGLRLGIETLPWAGTGPRSAPWRPSLLS